MPVFISGLELARLYYEEAVRPILQSKYPNLRHSAGLIGMGSEVLGFDDEMSADHNWGARVDIFVSEEDHSRLADELWQTLARMLPYSIHGYPTHFEDVPDEIGTVVPRLIDSHPINHRVNITTLNRFVYGYIGIELDRELVIGSLAG